MTTLTLPSITPDSICAAAKTPQPTKTPGGLTSQSSPTGTPPAMLPRPAGRSDLIEVTFRSASLDRELPLLLYLPPGYYESSRRYPTLYMLSGFAGDHHEWVNLGLCDTLESLIRGGHVRPMIVAMPEGDHSWWFNHASVDGKPGQRWGDYVWEDLVEYVDANYRTLASPESRAIGGLSAGGQAALTHAMTHPERFGVVGAHSPSFRGADGSVAVFGDWDYYSQHDPFWLLENTDAANRLAIWIDIAAGDYQWKDCNPPPAPQRCTQVFHDRLDRAGIQHDWFDVWPGIHDGYYWSEHLEEYLLWYGSKLVGE